MGLLQALAPASATNPAPSGNGLLDLLLGNSNPIAQFADSHRNVLGAIGAGLSQGPTFEQGLSNAGQLMPQARALDQQSAQALQAQNATYAYLQANHPDLAAAVKSGLPLQTAWQQALAQDALANKPQIVAPGSTVYQNGKAQYTAPEKTLSMAPGATIYDPNSGQAQYTAPNRPQVTWGPLTADDRKAAGIPDSDNTPYQKSSTGQIRTVVGSTGGASASADDGTAQSIADGIQKGLTPPTTTGLYRYGAAVKAKLADSGYDLTKATEDFGATQKLLSTMNGPQQVKLRQGTQQVAAQLQLVKGLAQQWNAGGFKPLNAVTRVAAAQGVLGPQAQSIVTRLNSAIADMTAELGTVYMGGNSPTDHSLELAGQNLDGDWSDNTLNDNLDQIGQNLQIRLNSLNLATGGIPTSQYNQMAPSAPTLSVPTAASPGGVTPNGVKWSVSP